MTGDSTSHSSVDRCDWHIAARSIYTFKEGNQRLIKCRKSTKNWRRPDSPASTRILRAFSAAYGGCSSGGSAVSTASYGKSSWYLSLPTLLWVCCTGKNSYIQQIKITSYKWHRFHHLGLSSLSMRPTDRTLSCCASTPEGLAISYPSLSSLGSTCHKWSPGGGASSWHYLGRRRLPTGLSASFQET